MSLSKIQVKEKERWKIYLTLMRRLSFQLQYLKSWEVITPDL